MLFLLVRIVLSLCLIGQWLLSPRVVAYDGGISSGEVVLSWASHDSLLSVQNLSTVTSDDQSLWQISSIENGFSSDGVMWSGVEMISWWQMSWQIVQSDLNYSGVVLSWFYISSWENFSGVALSWTDDLLWQITSWTLESSLQLAATIILPSVASPTLDLTVIPQPQLIVSEVFIDGTDEWFELTNLGSTLFTGTLTLSGTKAGLLTLTNVSLLAGESRVYGDIMSRIANQWVIARSGLSLNMADTASINVILNRSGQQIDSFMVSSTIVNTYDNTSTAFEKITSGTQLVIQPVTILRTRNILSQWIANPGDFDDLASTWSGTSTWSVNTGSTGGQTSWFSLGLLKITEVYFEGRQEWIEITNFNATDFTGTLTLIGANNGTIVLSGFTVPANTSVIVADNDVHIIDKSIVLVSWLTMVLNDLWAIDISLLHQWSVIDRFDIDVSLVSPYVNGTNSFERVWYQWSLKITPSTGTRVFNIQSGIIANPGKVFTVADPIIVLDDDDWLDNGGGTWSVSTWVISTGSCIASYSLLTVVELHHQTTGLADYVEIIPMMTLSGLSISPISGQEFVISQTLRSGHRYVIASSPLWFPLPERVLVMPWFDLAVGGGSLILRVGWQVVDHVVYGGAGSQQSLWLTSSDPCHRMFASSQIASPGFDERLLSYTQTQIQTITNTVTNTVYVWGWWWGSSCSTPAPINTGQICQSIVSSSGSFTGSVQTGVIKTGNSLTGVTSSGFVSSGMQTPRILGIDYDPVGTDTNRESITLWFDGLLPHSLRSYTLQRGTTRKTMTALVMTSSVQIFTGNWTFPNTPTCIKLQSGTIVLDEYCYPKMKSPEWSGMIQSWVIETWTYVPLKIDHILYDPPGTDTNKETVTLSTVSSNGQAISYPINMSRYTLHRGRTIKNFPANIQTSPQTILSRRSFPNKSTCVQLRFDKTIIVDTYCYTVTKPIKPIKGSGSVLTGTKPPARSDTGSIIIPEISIVSLIADPEGSDKGNESITLLLHSPMSFNLSEARLWWWKTTKKIAGMLTQGQHLTVTGNFWFPNRDECINLLVNKQIIDTYCYVKSEEKSEKEKKSEEKKKVDKEKKGTGENYFLLDTGTQASIVSVMPNPKWTDKGRESISFLLLAGEQLDLSHTYLQVGTKKIKTLSGILESGRELRQIWSFWLPNKATCFEWKVRWSDQLIDKFCYSQPKDNMTVRRSVDGLEELTQEQVLALGQIGLLKRGKDICATYNDEIIRCRRLPTRAVRLPRTDELRLYQNYVSRIHALMKDDWYAVYAYTPFIQFNRIFEQLKDEITKFRTQIMLSDGERVPVYNLSALYDDVYWPSYYDQVTRTIADVILWSDSLPRKRLRALWVGDEVWM